MRCSGEWLPAVNAIARQPPWKQVLYPLVAPVSTELCVPVLGIEGSPFMHDKFTYADGLRHGELHFMGLENKLTKGRITYFLADDEFCKTKKRRKDDHIVLPTKKQWPVSKQR